MATQRLYKERILILLLILPFLEFGTCVGSGVKVNCSNESTIPCNWPAGIAISRTNYENWSQTHVVPNISIATPKITNEVLSIVNWAADNGFKVRATGSTHSWAPLTVSPVDDSLKTILIDTKPYLNKMKIESQKCDKNNYIDVWTETGATLENLMSFLEEHGYGFTATPAIGEITIGGILAVGGHGHGIPAKGEKQLPGHGYGSLSNTIVSLRAIVWDEKASKYIIQSFERTHPDAPAFFTSLGRTFITDVTLRVGINEYMRCESFTDISAKEFFSNDSSGNTIVAFLEESGRIDIYLLPFIKFPWIKKFTVTKEKPLESRLVTSPYNYEFPITTKFSELKDRMLSGNWALTPEYTKEYFSVIQDGLKNISSTDIWGTSKNVILCMTSNFFRIIHAGIAVITKRENVPNVLSASYEFYRTLIQNFQLRNKYPMNMFIEMRVTGLDNPDDIMIPGSKSSYLSMLQPPKDFPNFDVAIWYSILTLPNTPHAFEFYAQFEAFIFNNFKPPHALSRGEWSKGWAFTNESAWTNRQQFNKIKSTYPDWDEAKRIFNNYDPKKIFYNRIEEFMFDN